MRSDAVTNAAPPRIAHVVSGLLVGGAETMMVALLSRTVRRNCDQKVISLSDEAPLGQAVRDLGIPVVTLGMARGRIALRPLSRLIAELRAFAPDVIQTWMYHADLLGGIAGRLLRIPVVWGVHTSDVALGTAKRTTLWTRRGCALVSRVVPRGIVYVSHRSREIHEALGYDGRGGEVIPNGFDTSRFAPDAGSRRNVRRELDIPEDAPLVGMVARFEPPKDHETFVRAAGILADRITACRFVMCGRGVDGDNAALSRWIAERGLTARFKLLGHRPDVHRINAALDLATLSSRAEAFPLVIGEAMACGVPAVVSDVGDAAALVGDTGVVVPVGDAEAMAAAWGTLLGEAPQQRADRAARARARVREMFDLDLVAARYDELHRRMSRGRTRPAPPMLTA